MFFNTQLPQVAKKVNVVSKAAKTKKKTSNSPYIANKMASKRKLKLKARKTVRRTKVMAPIKPITQQTGGYMCVFPFCISMPADKFKVLQADCMNIIKSDMGIPAQADSKTAKIVSAIEYFTRVFLHSLYDKMSFNMRSKFKSDADQAKYIKEFIGYIMKTHNENNTASFPLPNEYYLINSEGYFVDSAGRSTNNSTKIKITLSGNELTAGNVQSRILKTLLDADKQNVINIPKMEDGLDPETIGNYLKQINKFIFTKLDTDTPQLQNGVLIAFASKFVSGSQCNPTTPNNCNEVIIFKSTLNPNVLDTNLKESDFVCVENKAALLKYYYNQLSSNTEYKKNLYGLIKLLKSKSLIQGSYVPACIKYLNYRDFLKKHQSTIRWQPTI